MKKSSMRFLSSVLVLFTCGVVTAQAAPTVKRLGTNNARVGVNATTVNAPTPTRLNAAPTEQRLGGIRAVSSTGSIPANRVVGSGTSGNNANRLGFKIGPYIQTGSSVKPAANTTTTTPSTQPSDPAHVPSNIIYEGDDWIFVDDNQISLNPDILTRITNVENNKQNNLTVGEGLSLEGDNLTLNLDEIDLPGGTAYTGNYGISVDDTTHEIGIDIENPVQDAEYVFKNGVWVPRSEESYSGNNGIAVNSNTHKVGLDLENPVQDAEYVFKNGVWVPRSDINYSGNNGIAVNSDTHKVGLDLENPVQDAEYVFKNGEWVPHSNTIYSGNNGIAVNSNTHKVGLDLENPVQDAEYVFKNGVWVPHPDYTGNNGIKVNNTTHKIGIDLDDPEEGAMYVYRDGAWVKFPFDDEWQEVQEDWMQVDENWN